MDASDSREEAYCLMCKSGAEIEIRNLIEKENPGLDVVVAQRVMHEKKQGQWHARERMLLPGYLFIFSKGELPHDLLRKFRNLYRVLQYEKGMRALRGEDRDYAMWIRRHHGRIEASVVLIEGQSVRAIEGPLLDSRGKIIRFDKHKRRAWVAFQFDGQERVVSLSAHWIMAEDKEKT